MRAFSRMLVLGLLAVVGVPAPAGAETSQTVEFTTPGSFQFVVPDGTTSLDVQLVGGGGGGAGGVDGGGGGGGGSGGTEHVSLTVTPGMICTGTVGAGGAGGAPGSPGGAGGSSTITCGFDGGTATGGQGGLGSVGGVGGFPGGTNGMRGEVCPPSGGTAAGGIGGGTGPGRGGNGGAFDCTRKAPSPGRPGNAGLVRITFTPVADVDADEDTVPDSDDNCPAVANIEQADADGDGVGDACDPDVEGDNVANETDNCPIVPNGDQLDADGDGKGAACDTQELPVTKDECENDGYKRFDGTATFKNQGDCVSFIAAGGRNTSAG